MNALPISILFRDKNMSAINRARGFTGPTEFSNVVIGPKIVEHNNKYKVHVTFMEGDADGYQHENVYFKLGEEEDLIDFMNFMSRCAVAYPHGKGGYDGYEHVEGYDKWTEHSKYSFRWGYCYDGEVVCSFEAVEVTYFDDNGCEFKVAMKR